MITIYHNPRCSKSRQTLALIQEKGKEYTIKEYLKNPPERAELKQITELLGIKPQDLIRKGEEVYKKEYKGKTMTDDEWLDAMVSHPKLIERPIVLYKHKAVIGRPPESILDIL